MKFEWWVGVWQTVKDDNIDKYKSNFSEIQVSGAHLGNQGCFYMAGMKGEKEE